MKAKTEYLTFNTQGKREYVNITDDVARVVADSQITEGMVLVSAMRITAGVFVNDAESGLLADIDEWLEQLAPYRDNYRHHRTGETNGDAHLKNLLVHHEVIVPITEGRLDMGPWQQVYYAEFDGRRPKRLVIKAMEIENMSITIRCEHCRKQIKAPDSAAGKRGKCPHCGKSTYIAAPVSEEEIVPLAALDEDAERREHEESAALRQQEWDMLSETTETDPKIPLEHQEDVAPGDLYHFVVNYCLDMASSKLDTAHMHAEKLRGFGDKGAEAVDDFLTGKALEPALGSMPVTVLNGFLKQLKEHVS